MKEIMTVKEIAEYLNLNPATIYKLARSGGIPAVKIGSEWRFPKEFIDDWLAEQISDKFAIHAKRRDFFNYSTN